MGWSRCWSEVQSIPLLNKKLLVGFQTTQTSVQPETWSGRLVVLSHTSATQTLSCSCPGGKHSNYLFLGGQFKITYFKKSPGIMFAPCFSKWTAASKSVKALFFFFPFIQITYFLGSHQIFLAVTCKNSKSGFYLDDRTNIPRESWGARTPTNIDTQVSMGQRCPRPCKRCPKKLRHTLQRSSFPPGHIAFPRKGRSVLHHL